MAQHLLACAADGDGVSVTPKEQLQLRQDLLELFEVTELEKYYTEPEIATHPERKA